MNHRRPGALGANTQIFGEFEDPPDHLVEVVGLKQIAIALCPLLVPFTAVALYASVVILGVCQ